MPLSLSGDHRRRHRKPLDFGDKCTVDVDIENNEIVGLVNFKNESKVVERYAVNSTNDLIEVIANIEQKSSLGEDYKLVSSESFNDDYWVLVWENLLDKDSYNPYDSVKVTVDRRDKSIVTLKRFQMVPEMTKPQITEEEAIQAAQPIQKRIGQALDGKVSLTVVRPNFFWNEGGPYAVADFVRLAYKVSFDEESYIVYIDAITGENIGGTVLKADGKAFATSSLSYASDSCYYAKDAFGRLGYNALASYVSNTSALGTNILNYWNSSTAYAFYVDCHGNSTTLSDNSTWSLNSNQVSGNWYFVFLDACDTAANTTWANAFKINGYSKRAYLGWSATVDTTKAYEFCTYFFPETYRRSSTTNVRDAAVWAAGLVPGSGSTPIRFYGDTSYNGQAY